MFIYKLIVLMLAVTWQPPPAVQLEEAQNAARADIGLPPMRHSYALQRVAELRIEHMLANAYVGHGPPGEKFGDVMVRQGIQTWSFGGENIQYNNYEDPVKQAMLGWNESYAHWENVTDPLFNYIGCAAWQGEKRLTLFVCIYADAWGLD